MKIAGIIAEYNPFHCGHAYHIRKTRELTGADYIIAVMSGDYVQRGEPAICEKHVRAEMALRCGADLVLELPVEYATGSAEFFADGAVRLLNSLGVVTHLCFGCETEAPELLREAAELLAEEPPAFRELLREQLREGIPFARARGEALARTLSRDPADPFFSSPNSILGLEYCKALRRLNSPIRPVVLLREGNGYHDPELRAGSFCSATALRRVLLDIRSTENRTEEMTEEMMQNRLFPFVPDGLRDLYRDQISRNACLCADDLSLLLHYLLLKADLDTLTSAQDLSPELAHRILNHRNEFTTFTAFTSLLKTKELAYSRIQRSLLHLLLEIPDCRTVPYGISYARILGIRREALPLLTVIEENSSVPLLSRPARAAEELTGYAALFYEKNILASNLRESCAAQISGQPFRHEYQKQMVLL